MQELDINKIDRQFMLTENSTENAVLNYLWNIIQNVPVEDYLQEAATDENVSNTLAYLRLACFIPFFLRASDIVWDFDDGGDRAYSFNDNLRELVLDDELINPYTLNIIKNCLQNKGLINLSDFDALIDDEYFYNDEKWSFFKALADCFSVRKYLKSLHINDLTVLFSNICDNEDAQNLANSVYAPGNMLDAEENNSSNSIDNHMDYDINEDLVFTKEDEPAFLDCDLDELPLSQDDLDFTDESEESESSNSVDGGIEPDAESTTHKSHDDVDQSYESECEDEYYVHEFDSQDDFVEFVVQHSDELFPKAPTSIQCHLYSFLNGDCD
ncbi:hypothetical protein SAMN02910357_00177 [Succinivibrio dextrinosolvens]|uniref:hypothetical protein n=1 Tax=Succinivibrio dextrinosolvens TaxID=83771 RepID=UPI0008F3D279|nr:hypothetical protein [Succinivibrio dextrinosolvens]SFS33061.1 hypothetical protein SAMN02910357_00177 [Succinivibrio dextrinosolvens]